MRKGVVFPTEKDRAHATLPYFPPVRIVTHG